MPKNPEVFNYTCSECNLQFQSRVFLDVDHRICRKCVEIITQRSIAEFSKKRVESLPLIIQNVNDEYGDKEIAGKMISESVFIFGPSGTGKTILATFILKARWEKGLPGLFINYPKFIFKLQSDYDGTKNDVEKMMTCDMLVIDDFGKEKYSEFVRQTSYLIIESRNSDQLQTVITSNQTLNSIDKNIDPAIASRIYALCKLHDRSKFDDRRMVIK